MMIRLFRIVLLLALAASSLLLIAKLKASYWPGNQQGYEPVQPIAFSHALHAGKLQVACVYCHIGADKSKHAGFPAASLCMNCHRLVTASREDVLRAFQKAQQAGRPAQPVVSKKLR